MTLRWTRNLTGVEAPAGKHGVYAIRRHGRLWRLCLWTDGRYVRVDDFTRQREARLRAQEHLIGLINRERAA